MSRLSHGDLVKPKKSMYIKGERISVKDSGIVLELLMTNGYSTAKIFWTHLGKYMDDVPTIHLERLKGV